LRGTTQYYLCCPITMPQKRNSRRGSLEYWPRKRSRRSYARVRSWVSGTDAKLLGFAGYKVGMAHLIIKDNKKSSTTKGMEIFCPATIIECPPLKSISIRFYKKTENGLNLVSENLSKNFDKNLSKTISIPKKKDRKSNIPDFDNIKILVHTLPSLAGVGKKKPEIFEIALGGKKEDQLKYAQDILGKEIQVNQVFKEGQQLDVHAITKGKGVQGPVKRFGIDLKHHKTEKTRRAPGSLGGWVAQGHLMWRLAKAGKMGYHLRTEHNKWLLKIGNPGELKKTEGFHKYGSVKSHYILVKGSVIGSKKRLIRFNHALMPGSSTPTEAPPIISINL
jgi:large subunit ribosomal protein L3